MSVCLPVYLSVCLSVQQEGDVIELIENIDDYWYLARNVDNDNQEGLILVNDMKIIKRLPGEDKVVSTKSDVYNYNKFTFRFFDRLGLRMVRVLLL